MVQASDENFDEAQFAKSIFDDMIVFQDVNEVFDAILMIWNRAERETECLRAAATAIDLLPSFTMRSLMSTIHR